MTLEQEIANYTLSIEGGGFYVLKRVKYAANVFVDVWILLEQLEDPSQERLLKEHNGLPEEELA